jgi:hypothetical protein
MIALHTHRASAAMVSCSLDGWPTFEFTAIRHPAWSFWDIILIPDLNASNSSLCTAGQFAGM